MRKTPTTAALAALVLAGCSPAPPPAPPTETVTVTAPSLSAPASAPTTTSTTTVETVSPSAANTDSLAKRLGITMPPEAQLVIGGSWCSKCNPQHMHWEE
jgi:hypothetical protein